MAYAPFLYVPSQQVRKDLTYGRYNWSLATDQYAQLKYLDALCSTISYIDAEAGERFRADPKTGIEVSHGSVQLHIAVSDNQLQVIAPFADIAAAQKLIVLRKVCEMNFTALNLAKMECKEDTICFIYSCPLEACEPWKIYEILREICWTADKHDDDFVIMHGATRIYQPQLTPFTESRKQQSWQGFKGYLQEACEWVDYWKQAGYLYVCWDVIYMTLLKIDHLCSPQGSLKNSLDTNINKLFEKKEIGELVEDGAFFLNSLDKLPQSAFLSQLYDVSVFIPFKVSATATNVQDALKPFLTDADAYLTKKDIINGYLCLQKAVFRLFYFYRFNQVQWEHLEGVLACVNAMTITDAATKLYEALSEFYNNPRDLAVVPAKTVSEEKKPSFSNWFA